LGTGDEDLLAAAGWSGPQVLKPNELRGRMNEPE
jgi:hypothetical protein